MKQGSKARTTLGDLHHATSWLWLHCAAPVIQWGPETSSDKLRQCARCIACGNKGQPSGIQAGAAPILGCCLFRPPAAPSAMASIKRRLIFPSRFRALAYEIRRLGEVDRHPGALAYSKHLAYVNWPPMNLIPRTADLTKT